MVYLTEFMFKVPHVYTDTSA